MNTLQSWFWHYKHSGHCSFATEQLCLRDLQALTDSCHDLHDIIPDHILQTVKQIFNMFELEPIQMFTFLEETQGLVLGSSGEV